MAIRGRKPKTTAEKRRTGNPGRRPLNDQEPQGLPLLGLAPEWLPAAAKTVWAEWWPIVSDSQPVEDRDLPWFVQLCVTGAKWRRAVLLLDAELEAGGDFTTPTESGIKTHPLVPVMATLGKELRILLAEGGLTPTARSRIMAPAPDATQGRERRAAQPRPLRAINGGKA